MAGALMITLCADVCWVQTLIEEGDSSIIHSLRPAWSQAGTGDAADDVKADVFVGGMTFECVRFVLHICSKNMLVKQN